MEKILEEIFTALKEKVSSPFFRYYVLSWSLWNYKFVYFLVFQDHKIFFDVHGITKFDYLQNCTFHENWLLALLFLFVFPLLSTLFFLYIFPLVNIKFLEKYLGTMDSEGDVKQNHKIRIKMRHLAIVEITLKEKQKEVAIKKEEKQIEQSKTEKQIWKDEYDKIKNNGNFLGAIKELKYCFYTMNGTLTDRNYQKYISENNLGILDTNLLVNINFKDDQISLTPKGKFFMSQFLNQ